MGLLVWIGMKWFPSLGLDGLLGFFEQFEKQAGFVDESEM